MTLYRNINGQRVAMTQEEAEAFEASRAPDPGRIAAEARQERDRLLSETDWTMMPDAPVDQQAWRDYRQALRDVPKQPGFPHEIDWPERPAG